MTNTIKKQEVKREKLVYKSNLFTPSQICVSVESKTLLVYSWEII